MAFIDVESPSWREAVLADIDRLLGMGVHSISWDIFLQKAFWRNPKSPPAPLRKRTGIHSIGYEILNRCRKFDPKAVFSGECHGDLHAQVLHYTWEWCSPTRKQLESWAPFRTVFKTPRRSVNVDRSIRGLLRGFADGAYINVMPAAGPNHANATGHIVQYPELSSTLKRLAALRKRFLKYFAEGEYTAGLGLNTNERGFIRLWRCGSDFLLVLLNDSDKQQTLEVKLDLAHATSQPPQKYTVKTYDIESCLVEESAFKDKIEIRRRMDPDGLLLFELLGEN